VRIAARVLHSLRCHDRSCPVSNSGPIAPEADCLLVLLQLNSVVEGAMPASRTSESKNQLFPTNHDPAANPKAPAPDSLQAQSHPTPKASVVTEPFRAASVSEPRSRAPAKRLSTPNNNTSLPCRGEIRHKRNKRGVRGSALHFAISCGKKLEP